MEQDKNRLLTAFIFCIAVGLNFGLWVESFNAGMLGTLLTWMAFYFHDGD